jgi:hypothetical protein
VEGTRDVARAVAVDGTDIEGLPRLGVAGVTRDGSAGFGCRAGALSVGLLLKFENIRAKDPSGLW